MTQVGSPLGRVLADADGARLEFRRDHRVPVEDLWAALTEPERLARWIGTWTGEPEVGGTVLFSMLHEAELGDPEPVTILECEPRQRLVVRWQVPDAQAWEVALTLTPSATGSSLLFSQRLDSTEGMADIGPGWQWYLDKLAAALGEAPEPAGWDDYFPPLRESYAVQVRHP